MKAKRKIYDFDKIAERDFVDVFMDVWTPPDCLTLYEPDFGNDALHRDMQRIGGDFRRVINTLDLPVAEKSSKKRKSTKRARKK